jgi:integral membrane protein
MLKIFRIASLLEGCSYLLILTASFGIISRDFVFPIGMAHGVLFLLYFVLSLSTSHKQGWSVALWLLVLLAAVIPFAFVPVELFLQRELRKNGIAPKLVSTT